MQLSAALRTALAGLRSRRARAVTTGLGVALAAAMLAAAVVISYGLGTGFTRAAKAAGLPTIVVRFDPQRASVVRHRILALPDVARYSLRFEVTAARLAYDGHRSRTGVVEVLDRPGVHVGYDVVAGENLPPRGSDALIEKGLAESWGVGLGDTIQVAGLGPEKVVGIAEGPDDVGYPLAAPRIYISRPALDARYGRERQPRVNLADIYLRDPRYVNEVLTQARATAFGLRNVQFLTSAGIRILLDQAAGIVIDLLIALSIIALITAGVLLAASARAEVQRRLGAIGVRRAVGETRGQVALAQGLEGLLVAVPFGSLGIAVGVLLTASPDSRLLTLLNEPAPASALIIPVVLAWLACRARSRAWCGLASLARGRWAGDRPAAGRRRESTHATNQADATRRSRSTRSASRQRATRAAGRDHRDARTVGRVRAPDAVARFGALIARDRSRRARKEVRAHRQPTSLRCPAGPGDPRCCGRRSALLDVGRRLLRARRDDRRDRLSGKSRDLRGTATRLRATPAGHATRSRSAPGLADALGLSEGSILAVEFGNGVEARFTVSGIVSSLQSDGRVAYVSARGLLRADPNVGEELAVVLSPNADQDAVERALVGLGATPTSRRRGDREGRAAGQRVADDPPSCRDRRRSRLPLCADPGLRADRVRTSSDDRGAARVRGGRPAPWHGCSPGAVAMLVVPAAIIGVLLERFVFGPGLSRLAENYATLPLDAGAPQILAVLAGLAVAAGRRRRIRLVAGGPRVGRRGAVSMRSVSRRSLPARVGARWAWPRSG